MVTSSCLGIDEVLLSSLGHEGSLEESKGEEVIQPSTHHASSCCASSVAKARDQSKSRSSHWRCRQQRCKGSGPSWQGPDSRKSVAEGSRGEAQSCRGHP